jgi:ATP-dependent DNA helicase DinG
VCRVIGSRRVTVRDVLGEGGFATTTLRAFDVRSAQLEMAESIYDRLLEGGVLSVEAPTGVGKTLAYLVPAILARRRRVIVSTHTKTLQDQIVDKDLPLLQKVMAEAGIKLVRATDEVQPMLIDTSNEIRFAVMKGRANYLCLDRLDRKTRQLGLSLFLEEEPELLEEIRGWSENTSTGDRAELAGLSERSSLWAEIDARAEICTGAKCPRYDRCFVVRMRRMAQNAELVIVNHHLLLADLALKAEARLQQSQRSFGEVIPPGDALIIDEAHALEEIASEYFGGRVSTRMIESLARDVSAHLAAEPREEPLDLVLARAIADANAVMDQLPRLEGKTRVRRSEVAAEDPLSSARESMKDATSSLTALASDLVAGREPSPTAEALARRVRGLGDGMSFVLEASDPDYVYWTERQTRSVAMGASPINVAHLLSEHLFPQFGAVIATSATLAAGEAGCRYFLDSVGAPPDTYQLILDSPFEYPRQAALYLPHDAPDPESPTSILSLARIGKSLIDLVGGGALFLFTSYRAMRSVHAQLAGALDFPVLCQGERPQRDLLRIFVERSPSVLFATASFWEGVDVPGDPLRLVLIDRLPFGSPQDPLAAARAERIESRGESAFNRFYLPRAILRLKQGFGRLVRGKDDRGVVAILDRRVQTRGYGKRFLRALPKATPIHRLPDLADWLSAKRDVEQSRVEYDVEMGV